jgi:catechol 2,3-dioxygenase-like lactoylglutathione lyase family enzyme
MTTAVDDLVQEFAERRLSRRELVVALTALFAAGGSKVAAETSQAAAQTNQVVGADSLNHVSLAVTDVERSAEFYQTLLGLEVVSRPGNGGINLGLGSSFLGLYSLPEPGRVHHFCMGVDDFDADRLAASLGEVGLQASVDNNPRNRTSGGAQLYFSDPDGTLVQLSENGYQG